MSGKVAIPYKPVGQLLAKNNTPFYCNAEASQGLYGFIVNSCLVLDLSKTSISLF